MADELVAVEVMNGTVAVNDKIAYAAGRAYSGGGMRIGYVAEILTTAAGKPRLKVMVTQTSGGAGRRYDRELGRYVEKPYLKTIDGDTLRTVVKLNDTVLLGGGPDE